jgi:FMN reductase
MPKENQLNQHFDYRPARLVVFTGSTHRPSKSRALGEFLAARVAAHVQVEAKHYDIVDAGHGLGAAFSRKELTPEALQVLEAVEGADALIAITPVYKGSFTGLFKHLIDFVEPNSLLGKPVLIGATGGGHRHALIVEHQLRPLFGFFSASTAPTSVYASDGEFTDGQPTDATLLARIDQAATQFAHLIQVHEANRVSPRHALVADA